MKFTQALLDLIISLHKEGTPVSIIADKFRLDRSTIRRWLRAANIPTRPRGAHWKRPARYKDHNAHSKVQKALREGRLTRPESCESCQKPWDRSAPKTKPLAHHDDYNKPLDVRWLCTKCHYAWHAVNVPILHPNKGLSRVIGPRSKKYRPK